MMVIAMVAMMLYECNAANVGNVASGKVIGTAIVIECECCVITSTGAEATEALPS